MSNITAMTAIAKKKLNRLLLQTGGLCKEAGYDWGKAKKN